RPGGGKEPAAGIEALPQHTKPVARARADVRAIGFVDVDPVNVVGRTRALTSCRVECATAIDGEHLEAPPPREGPTALGDEAIQTRLGAILSLVHDAGPRIDGDGLVDEAAHRLDRLGVGEPVVR